MAECPPSRSGVRREWRRSRARGRWLLAGAGGSLAAL